MALNNFKCNHLTPLHFKGLTGCIMLHHFPRHKGSADLLQSSFSDDRICLSADDWLLTLLAIFTQRQPIS